MTTARYGNDPLYFVKNGVVFTIAGVLLMLLVMRMPVALFKALAPLALVVSLVLLVAVMIPGVGGDHQRRPPLDRRRADHAAAVGARQVRACSAPSPRCWPRRRPRRRRSAS